jgi:hypothetical protein
LIELTQVLAVPIAGWIVRQLGLILAQLKSLNGRLSKSESWQEGHGALDQERFNALQRELNSQESRCIEHLRRTTHSG